MRFFSWHKPTSYWGTPMTMETPVDQPRFASRHPCPWMVEEAAVSGACAMAEQRTLTSISLLVSTERTQLCCDEWYCQMQGSKKKLKSWNDQLKTNFVDCKAWRFSSFFLVPQFSGCLKIAWPHAEANARNNHTIPYHTISYHTTTTVGDCRLRLLHLAQQPSDTMWYHTSP